MILDGHVIILMEKVLPSSIMFNMTNKHCESIENKGMQPLVDKVQGLVGGVVKRDFDNLRPANPRRLNI